MPRGIPYFFEAVVMGAPGEWEKEGGKRSGGLNLDTSFQVVSRKRMNLDTSFRVMSRKHRISPAPPARYISTIALLHHQQQKNGPQPVFLILLQSWYYHSLAYSDISNPADFDDSAHQYSDRSYTIHLRHKFQTLFQ